MLEMLAKLEADLRVREIAARAVSEEVADGTAPS